VHKKSPRSNQFLMAISSRANWFKVTPVETLSTACMCGAGKSGSRRGQVVIASGIHGIRIFEFPEACGKLPAQCESSP
jgi:hypothetical protein